MTNASTPVIPVFINCWNRVTYAKAILPQITALPGAWPILIDNASTWPPMREWVDERRQESTGVYPAPMVWPLRANVGCYSVWAKLDHEDRPIEPHYGSLPKDIADMMGHEVPPVGGESPVPPSPGTEGERILDYFPDCPYYVVTDDDLDLADVPKNVLGLMRIVLEKYPDVTKVGLSLSISDLPDSYPLRDHVIREQSQYWEKVRCLAPDRYFDGPLTAFPDRDFDDPRAMMVPMYEAPSDTTFAMYRMSDTAKLGAEAGRALPGLRLGPPYTAKHRPWYVDPKDYDAEAWYGLVNSRTFTYWTKAHQAWARARGIVPNFGGEK